MIIFIAIDLIELKSFKQYFSIYLS